ncbi:heavy metal translocating P-type ATPase [Liquorilactobacillus uvarum]|uniref:Cd(2+)-exporting ATPase n=1 Tax=Liquorilactobacillus uvarum DSM 19971 TaxID=1423812 RepID=A0A0R1Q118_9LACO|nr:heavy metal translocating P-type ATPase [Liquorilactobacillus uvarum]KRL36452.1 cadmium-translocating p-type atpase [Liquorilactobacillus uvarum DSM 19971]
MNHLKKLWIILGITLTAIILQFILYQQLLAQITITIVGIAFSLIMLKEMLYTLQSGSYGIDLLAITAIISTLAVNEYWASIVVLIMLVGGETLEDYATKKANLELKALLDNSPRIAHRIKNNVTTDTKVENIKISESLLVKPGELVPVDGYIIKGEGQINESSLTGEAQPIFKRLGDYLMSGSLNQNSSIIIKVDKTASDSQYQQLVKLVKKAKEKPSHFVRLADKYALPFTLTAYIIAGIAWFVSKNPVHFAEVLVVASPCPLILAAPVAIISGMSRSSRNGIIVKTGDIIEKLATAKTGAFDKTGTVTDGNLTVSDLIIMNNINKREMLNFIASIEQNSDHILARASVIYALKNNAIITEVDSFSEDVGKGVSGVINGQFIKIGKLSFVAPDSKLTPTQQTTLYISVNSNLWGYINFVDHIRPEASRTISMLRKLGIDNLMILTGDQEKSANYIAEQIGIKDVHADLLPKEKIAALKNISKKIRPIFMVGDGVNDAPALATADIGIAMGMHGSSAASESADVVILKDDLTRVYKAISISRDTMLVAKQSVLIGIVICLVLMLIASTGIIPAFIGAMLQEVVDTISILWALKARNSSETNIHSSK